MLRVSLSPDGKYLYVACERYNSYINRLRKIPGATFLHKEKRWRLPSAMFLDLEQLFKGELVFSTPRHQILNQPPPHLPYYDDVVPVEVEGIKQELYGFQKFGASFLNARVNQHGFGFLCDETGIGKGHPASTNVLTPEGWHPIGDLKPGDVVTGSCGKPINVKKVHYRGVLPVYRVTFNDGASVLVDGDHLWAVRDEDGSCAVKETKELINSLTDHKWYIPTVAPIVFKRDEELKLDPYVLGLLISSGNLANDRVISFTTYNGKIMSNIVYLLPKGAVLKYERINPRSKSIFYVISSRTKTQNPVALLLDELNLLKVWPRDRFIPNRYLFSNVENRISLLQGLMDGVAKPGDFMRYTTMSSVLARDIQFLIRSLGGLASIREMPIYVYQETKHTDQTVYQIDFSMPDMINPYRAWSARYTVEKVLNVRFIKSIKPAGEAGVVCITVDSPDSLYVTEDFIVTHNSPQALATSLLLNPKRTLIVSPASVRHQWAVDTVPKFLGDVDITEVRGDSEKRKKLYGVSPFTVVNYEALLRDIDYLIGSKMGYELVIFDECQRLKNNTGLTHRAAYKLVKKIEGRIFLTATPLMNELEELHALFRIAKPKVLGKLSDFRKEHMIYEYRGYPKLIGYKNLDVLTDKVMPYILRRTSDLPEVAGVLPELVVTSHYVTPTDLQRRIHEELYTEWQQCCEYQSNALRKGDFETAEKYDSMSKGYIVLMLGISDAPALFNMSTSKMISDKYKQMCRNIKGSPKLSLLKELVEDFIPTSKVVVFTQFERMSRLIYNTLSPLTDVALYTGENLVTRDADMDRFKTNPDCRVIVMTDAGGVGINLQVAHYLINYDLPWSPGQLQQRYGRIKRIGSTANTVFAINLVTRELIDERIVATLEKKEDISGTVIQPILN